MKAIKFSWITILIFIIILVTGCVANQHIKPVIAVGGRHACFLTSAGGVMCWGNNYHGELGNGTNETSSIPVVVNGLTHGVYAIATGGFHNCVATQQGVECWGENESGQLGDGTTINRNQPVKVIGLTNDIIALTAGESFTCVLTRLGGVKCWGSNNVGQLGDGTITDRSKPVDVSGLDSNIIAIAAYGSRACALTRLGNVKCWGLDFPSEMDNGHVMEGFRKSPMDVIGLSGNAIAIAPAGEQICVLMGSGTVKCWGNIDLTRYVIQPMDIAGLPDDIIAIAAGDVHVCALSRTEGVKCWGDNEIGQLGDGTTISSFSQPMAVLGLNNGVTAISAGGAETCALLNSNEVKCWGWNGVGQLGDGTTINRNSPVDVIGIINQ
jgi:alpha-tubulin suppressor-like RCC1 family protein